MSLLLFLDTNILLDFYRLRSRDAGLSILKKLELHKESLIVTDQVAMEYKKNRQRVLLETLKNLTPPKWESLNLPPLLADTTESRAIEKHKRAINDYSKRLRARLTNAISKPARNDLVYKSLQSIWRTAGPFHLDRKKNVRLEIRELAKKRFQLGYPPRKDSDTSFGDAINWEWLVHCASKASRGVVIVTRDNDYGVNSDGEPVLNDWLREEFRERVGAKREIIVTDRITDALKLLSVRVTKKEEQATTELVKQPISNLGFSISDTQNHLRSIFGSGSMFNTLRIGPGLLGSFDIPKVKSGDEGA